MKKLTSVIAAGVVGVTVLGAVDVKADEVKETVDSSKTSTTEQTKQVVSTQADVDAAQAKLEATKVQVKAQEQVTNAAQTDAKQAEAAQKQAAAQEAKAAEIAKEATPETISKAEKEVTTKSDTVKTAEQSLSVAQEEQTKADQVVEAQKALVSEAEKTVEAKQADVTKAEKDVAEKQSLLDGTGAAKVIQVADEAKANLAQKETAKETADQNLASAKQADVSRQAKVNQARIDKVTKEAAFKAADQDLKEKTAAATETAKDLAQKEGVLTKAENAVKSMNKITLSPEYIAALKEYSGTSWLSDPAKRDDIIKKLKETSKLLGDQNNYVSNPSDDQETEYDLNNLPEHVSKEISFFASELVNQIREQMGTLPVEVTESSVAFAKKVTDNAVKSNWDTWKNGHNDKGISSVAKEYHLKGFEKEKNYWEDWAGDGASTTSMTIAQMKHEIYDSIVKFMFSQYEWMHAKDIAATDPQAGEYDSTLGGFRRPQHSYLGVSFANLHDYIGVHFLTVYDTHFTAQSTNFDRTALANPYDSATLLNNLNQAQLAVNAAKQANSVAQGAQISAQELYNQAQANLTKATEALTQAEAIVVQTPAAQQAQRKAQAELKAAQDTNAKAQANLAALNADVAAKKNALAAAKATLENKQAALTTVQTALKVEQNTLATRKAAAQTAANQVVTRKNELDIAKIALKEAKEYVEFLKNAPANLKATQKALTAAQETLKEKKAVLEVEMKKLEMLKVEEKEAADQHAQVMKAYKDYLEAKRQAKIVAEKAAIEKAGKTALPVFDANGQIVGYTEAKAPVQEPLAYGKTNHQATQTKRLPQTGTNATDSFLFVGVVIGMIVTILGFKKKEEN